MSPLILEGTNTTFSVILDPETKVFEFSGKSRPENVAGFFEPIFEWFDGYSLHPNEETIVGFKLEYYNSSTAKFLLRLLVKLEEMHHKGHKVFIHWFYRDGDEDIMESGADYSTLVTVPIELKEMV